MAVNFHLKAFGFVTLVIIGIPVNIFVLIRFLYILLTEQKLLPANTIRMSLTLANVFVLLSRVTTQALYSIGLRNLLNDNQCKVIIYTFRVSRAMSICITSFLSCHQCLIISPVTGKWKNLKQIVNRHVLIILMLLLAMNLVLYPSGILYGQATTNATLSPYTLRLVYCDVDFLNYPIYIINGSAYVIREIIFVGLMILSSTYMVYVLYRHGQAMKGKRSSEKGQGKTIEFKASRAVIVLVAMYLALFGMDNSAWIYTLFMSNVDPDVSDTRLFLAACFTVLSPIHIFVTTSKLHLKLKKKSVNIQTIILEKKDNFSR